MILASWRDVARTIKRSDIVVEVVDIRDPISTRSKRVEEMAESFNKKLILLLNKSDLVPYNIAEKWKEKFTSIGIDCIYYSIWRKKDRSLLIQKIDSYSNGNGTLVSLIGYPKTGKSSIINSIKGKKSAPTSPIPGSSGYTRSFTLYKIKNGIYFLDSPGVMPIEGGFPESIIRGKGVDELKDPVKPAVALIEKILKYNPKAFIEAYKIDEKDPYKILEQLAYKRMWLYKKTKEPNIDEAAKTIIRDYHKAKIDFYVLPD
ncbi:MAG: GTPase [Caldisphaera sp.]|jgi:Ras superfamily GTP-binding protein YlqF|uniref:GTPase n=1 Tax=Caldisphaera sp. TaxID=2060322 RepID=UPI00397A4F29